MRCQQMSARSWAIAKLTSRACRESKQVMRPLFSAELSWPVQRASSASGGGGAIDHGSEWASRAN